MNKQTSDVISSLAAKYLHMRDGKMYELSCGFPSEDAQLSKEAKQFFKDVRKLAASALSQDTTRGRRKRAAKK